jgi:putative flippase GtrA
MHFGKKMKIQKYLDENKIFSRFIFVGIINTIFGYSVYVLLIFIGTYYPIAVLVSTILGVVFNFKTIGRFVFKDKNYKRFYVFCFVYLITYLCNVSGLWLFENFGLHDKYLSGGILILPMAVISFYLNKTFVFREI